MRQPQFEKDSFRHVIRRQRARLLALTSLALLLLLVFASAAASSPGGVYTAAVDTTTATAGQSTVFTFTITNDATTSDVNLGSVNITPPSGWTSIQAGNNATASGGKSWNTVVQGAVVKLRAVTAPDDLLIPGEQVTIAVTANFCSAASPNWSTDADSGSGIGTEFTGGDFTLSGSEPALTVNSGTAATLVLTAATTSPAAGDADNLTITAKDGCGNTATSYTGTKDLTFGGASAAPDGTQPTVTSNNGTARNFGQNTNIDFTNGVASVSGSNNGVMKLFRAGAASITVTDGSIDNDSGLAVTVSPGALGALTITNPTPPLTAGVEFDVTVAAFDLFENPGADGYWNGPGCVVFLELISPSPALKQADDPAQGICPTAGHSELAFDASGVATANITVYRATTTFTVPSTQVVTVRAGNPTREDSTDALTVNPGTDLFRFRWTDEPLASQTAGQVFDRVEVSAYDEWDNIKTDYNPAGAVFSGLNRSPSGCNPDNVTPNPSGPDGCDPIYNLSFVNGIANSTTVKDYKAETTQLTVTDGSVTASTDSGTPDTFTVAPAALNRFAWTDQPNASQTAGVAFDSVAVTAYDAFGNVKTNYVPAATFSGLSQSPRGCNADNTTVNPAGTFGCNPIYGFTWLSGVATSTTAKDYKAETTSLTVTDGLINASSSSFTVIPNSANVPPTRFSQQPTLTEASPAVISPAVQVTVEDLWGNPRQGDPVAVAITTDPPGGSTLGGTLIQPTNASGIATFSNLTINKVGIGFTLSATTGSASTTSNAFDIANDVATCTGTCSATGSTPNRNTATVDAFGLGGGALSSRLGPAASAQSLSARLGMTVAGGTSISLPPDTSCGNLDPIGDPFWITTFESAAGDPPSYKIVARLSKALQKKSGATKYDICLGAINVNFPPINTTPGNTGGGCNSATTSRSWPTKDGTCAKFFNGYYWGLVRDYPSSQVNNTTGCPGSPTYPTGPPFNLFPGVYQKKKNGNDIVISLCKPSPWDGGGGWR